MSPELKHIDQLHQCRWAELGFDGLSTAEKRYVGIFWVSGDVYNGGFDQFFHNSSGDMALLALEGLRVVGAHQTAGLLAEAMSLIPSGYSADQDIRHDRISSIPEGEDRFDSVTRRFYANEERYEDMYLRLLEDFYDREGIRKKK